MLRPLCTWPCCVGPFRAGPSCGHPWTTWLSVPFQPKLRTRLSVQFCAHPCCPQAASCQSTLRTRVSVVCADPSCGHLSLGELISGPAVFLGRSVQAQAADVHQAAFHLPMLRPWAVRTKSSHGEASWGHFARGFAACVRGTVACPEANLCLPQLRPWAPLLAALLRPWNFDAHAQASVHVPAPRSQAVSSRPKAPCTVRLAQCAVQGRARAEGMAGNGAKHGAEVRTKGTAEDRRKRRRRAGAWARTCADA